MLARSPSIKQKIMYDIECYELCNHIISHPYQIYSREFIQNMLYITPNYEWEEKIGNALLALNGDSPNTSYEEGRKLVREFRFVCLQKIVRSPNYILFINAFNLRQTYMKQLILIYIKMINEIIKKSEKNYKSEKL